jgi:hypothetical protein
MNIPNWDIVDDYWAQQREEYDYRQFDDPYDDSWFSDDWLVDSDFVTNCDEDEVRFYEEASFQTHIPVIVTNDAKDCRGRPIPSYRAISIPRECRPKDEDGCTDLTDFWIVFDEIRMKALMPLI